MTTYALIENSSITRTGSLLAAFPNTSFPRPLPDTFEGWVKVVIPSIPDGKKLTNDIVLVGGVPTRVLADLDSADKISELTTYERAKRDGGITVGGVFIATTETDRSLVNGAVTRALLDNNDALTYPYYPTGGNTVSLTNAQYKAIGQAIAAHVQKCLDAYESVFATIGGYNTIAEVKGAFDAAYAA